MRRNRLVFLAVAFAAFSCLKASAQTYVVVEPTGGGEASRLLLSDVERVEFAGGQIDFVARSGGEGLAMPVSGVKVIKFESKPTSVEDAVSVTGGFSLVYDGRSLSAHGLADGSHAALYRADGSQIASYPAWDGSAISTGALPKGIYIFKVENKSIKFVK